MKEKKAAIAILKILSFRKTLSQVSKVIYKHFLPPLEKWL